MDGQQKPDAQSDGANDLNDDVIDLTQVVQVAKDDEIIDLTNVIDQPDEGLDALNEATDALPDTNDSIIKLGEPISAINVEEEAASALQQEDDEEIIDLADMETTIEADILESASEDDDEDDVIDLMEAIEPDPPVAEADSVDEMVDLTDMEAALEADDANEEAEDAADDEGIIDLLDAVKEDQTDTADEAITSDEPVEPPATGAVPLTEQQLEAALERTIHKIYAEKIEQLMVQTIEKTVQREIKKIKQALMEDDDGDVST